MNIFVKEFITFCQFIIIIHYDYIIVPCYGSLHDSYKFSGFFFFFNASKKNRVWSEWTQSIVINHLPHTIYNGICFVNLHERLNIMRLKELLHLLLHLFLLLKCKQSGGDKRSHGEKSFALTNCFREL